LALVKEGLHRFVSVGLGRCSVHENMQRRRAMADHLKTVSQYYWKAMAAQAK
jgi:hypothetical protein